MGKKSLKKQKLYKMKGCSKKNNSKRTKCKSRTRKYLTGGLAYTGNPQIPQSNPFLAYTGKGGSTADNISLPAKYDIMNPNTNLPSNPYVANPALPNKGPIPLLKSNIPTNMGSQMYGGKNYGGKNYRGGNCGTCQNIMTGGGCGCNIFSGGNKQKGGQTIDPQGLLGEPWGTTPLKWPDVDAISGNRNYLPYNNYKVDPQTSLISVGANPPFLFGGRKNRLLKRRQKGGTDSNLLSQDFLNLGRQIQYGIGSAYNAINGYAAPTPVLPWQGQLPRTPDLKSVQANSM